MTRQLEMSHNRHAPPQVAILANSLTPYRIHLHERIVREVPEIGLWSLTTHANNLNRWQSVNPPAQIRPVPFGHGEPTHEQPLMRFGWREWRKGGRIIQWLRQHQVRAVFCQGFGDFGRLRVMRWCHRHRVPCFLTGDSNIYGDNHHGLKKLLKRLVVAQAVRWCQGVMPCGTAGRLFFRRYGATDDQTFEFPFCPDLQLFADPSPQLMAEVRAQFGLRPERRRIVCCVRLVPDKRPGLALQAFAALADARPEWDLVMIGDGPLRAELAASVPPELTKRLIWTGFFDRMDHVAAIYRQSDVLLLPSGHEPWGVVVVEAAAAGMAIVASDVVGSAPDLVHSGRNGMIFKTDDAVALQSALLDVSDRNHIDRYKAASEPVLREWLEHADPVMNFRRALAACGVLPAIGEPVRINQYANRALT